MEKKYIHYCWFGTKPLPKLAKKCIKSWRKYLPDYEIIRWSEENVDLNECNFIKEAYANKNWAFVADYARTKAMYEMGGIYFDTDMIVTKNINFLMDKPNVLGFEDSNMVNAAVWKAEPKSMLAKELLDFYRKQDGYNKDDIYSYSIPRNIMRILNKHGIEPHKKEIQVLNGNIYIYPREYFYPLSYNYKNNVFTDNTCMIHYFDATWIPKWEQRENKIYRKLGEKNGRRFIELCRFSKKVIKKTAKICLFPIVIYKNYRRKISKKYLNILNCAISSIKSCNSDYIVLHNPDWFGVTSATIELFDNRIPCGEILRKKDIRIMGNSILQSNIKQVIFSAMCIGWKQLAIYLKEKKPSIKIKVFWHGNHSQVSEPYGWKRNIEIFELNKSGVIDVIGTCKKSLMNFYKKEGYNAVFITNKVVLNNKVKIEKIDKEKDKTIRIGLYAAKSDDWRKNMFAQMAAVALMDNVVLDVVPINNDVKQFAKYFRLKIDGIEKSIPRDELLERMSKNDLNLYVTFSECAPMLPLESFEVGVPCITGNNHHYWINDKLENYIVIKNEDSILEIFHTINKAIDNKVEIMKLYTEFRNKNIKNATEDVRRFLEL